MQHRDARDASDDDATNAVDGDGCSVQVRTLKINQSEHDSCESVPLESLLRGTRRLECLQKSPVQVKLRTAVDRLLPNPRVIRPLAAAAHSLTAIVT
jgi:hypothetical protein